MTHEEHLVSRARQGDRGALDELIASMKTPVYNLAIRMLGSAADAADATQEILIRLVTNLDGFRGESSLKTWTYRLAANHLMRERSRKVAAAAESFDELGERLDGLLADDAPGLEEQVLVQEAKLRCTSAMLQCLDRDHRLAFILGEILDLPSEQGAAVLEIAEDAFRKRVSRARTRLDEFMQARCGLVNPERPCTCNKVAACALKKGGLDPKKLEFASLPAAPSPVETVDGLMRAVAVFRSHPNYTAPDAVVSGLKQLLAQRAALFS